MADPRDPNSVCPECQDDSAVSRRQFVKGVGAAALVAGIPLIGRNGLAAAPATKVGPSPSALSETAVARLYKSLTKAQRDEICFAFDDAKRSKVGANWAIVKPTIGDLTSEQQALCAEIMKNLCSEEGFDRFTRQMEDDAGGLENYHVALFGEPGTDKPFEWVLTGRHDTLRADGNSVDGAAFGGPIFYGHAADGHDTEDSKHTNNVWWYQGEQANKIFATLDEAQQKSALVDKVVRDSPETITLKGTSLLPAGIAVASLDGQQKQMVSQLVEMMLRPFRTCDVEEVRECLSANGGVDKLQLTYFKEGDLGNDRVWDNWRLEGPAFSWFFRGAPHVHTWLNVARKA